MNRMQSVFGAVLIAVLAALAPQSGWAARVDVTVATPIGPYPTLPVTANAMDFTWTACDATNFMEFTFTGRELVLVNNTGATARWVTLESVAELGRTGDVTQYALQAGDFASYWAGNQKGWRQSGGKFYLKCEHAEVKLAIIRIPG